MQLEALEKVVTYFHSIYAVQFGGVHNGVNLLTDQAKVLLAAADGLVLLGNRVQSMMQTGHEGSDVAKSIKEVLTQAGQWQQYGRTIRRRLPADGSSGPINLPAEVAPKLFQTAGHLSRLLKTMQEWCRSISQQPSDQDAGVPVTKMRELAHAAADAVYMDDYTGDGGFFDSVHASLVYVSATFATVSTALVDGHYDFDGTPPAEAKQSPVSLRAQTLKTEIRDLENLRHKLEEREAIIKEMNLILRNKQDELSEMSVRKEMAEKKVANLSRDNEVAMEKLQRKLEDVQLFLKRKEKEYHETVEHLQSDMKTLEQEKAELKEKLMHSSKKVLLEGITKTASAGIGPTPFIPGSAAAASAAAAAASAGVARDSPALLAEISQLRQALRHTQAEKSRLLADELKTKVASLTPLSLPVKPTGPPSASSVELNKLIRQAEELNMVNLQSLSSKWISIDIIFFFFTFSESFEDV